MRIASLVPSSTEMLFALGLGEQVVAVTHECDWPPQAASIPHLTRTVVPAGLSAAEIDRAVRETVASGRPLYELDRERLEEVTPDLIVTQAVCDVCAVSYDDVVAVAATLPGRPRVLSLEWLDPPFIAGHWVPEMIRLAGGEEVLGRAGERSRTAEWAEIAAAAPEVAVVMPCGYDAARSAEEADAFSDRLDLVGAERTVAVDASAYFSRPGPRLVTGIELLGHIFHPDRVPRPAADYVAVA